ncbi:MAG: hypothetical protein GX981_10400 [Tissierellia bacterium]|nr:hypothetical protein [Tissierellia bacterium]
MKEKIAKSISLVTVAPVMAFFTVLLSFVYRKQCFNCIGWFVYTIVFLTLLPLLAYPLHMIIPASRNKGRKGERKMAFIMAIISYVLGTLLTFILGAPLIVKKIFMAYLLSGLFLSFINKVLKFKASGHACGVAGPITLISHILGTKYLWLFLLMPIVYWSRIKLGRHSIQELVTGTFVGILATFVAVSII